MNGNGMKSEGSSNLERHKEAKGEKKMKTDIYMIRHGETSWNRERRLQGHSDIPLSDKGKEQAEQLGIYMEDWKIESIYSSDLIRARQTAESIAYRKHLSVQTYSDLRERNFGEWEGVVVSEVKEKYPAEWETLFKNGGKFGIERTEVIVKRMMNRLTALATQHLGQQIAIVSHGGSIHLVLENVSQGTYGPENGRIDNTGISHLVFDSDKGWEVRKVNQVDHLIQAGLCQERA